MDCPAGHFVTIVCAEYQYQQAAAGSRLILRLPCGVAYWIENEIDFDYLLIAMDEFIGPTFLLFMIEKYADSTDSKW